jgi:hypothetical protein
MADDGDTNATVARLATAAKAFTGRVGGQPAEPHERPGGHTLVTELPDSRGAQGFASARRI